MRGSIIGIMTDRLDWLQHVKKCEHEERFQMCYIAWLSQYVLKLWLQLIYQYNILQVGPMMTE
jgi:hypothetical protein